MAELTNELKKEIELLIDQSNIEYDNSNYSKSIEFLEIAWENLPSPKTIYDESFHIANYLSETFLLVKDLKNAKKWSEILNNCDLERIDSGEREFLAGKIAFESGNLEEARNLFNTAYLKSEGRCFEGEDVKYKSIIV